MMPSPPIQQPSDARHSGWLSASTAPAYCRSINRPAVTPPTLSGNARCARSARHPHPSCEAKRWGGRFDPTSPNLTPRLNPHRARGTDGAPLPAISCLGAFQTPAARARRGLVTAGVRKPAQLPTSGEPPLTAPVEPSRSSNLSDGSRPHCGHCREPVAGSQWGRHRGRQAKARQSRHRRDLGVSPATLYRYIPTARTANTLSVADFS